MVDPVVAVAFVVVDLAWVVSWCWVVDRVVEVVVDRLLGF